MAYMKEKYADGTTREYESPDLPSLIAMGRPSPPVYQEDEESGKDVIRPVPLRTPDGKEAEILLRPGDPRWDEMFQPRYEIRNGKKVQVNTLAPDPLPDGSERLVVPESRPKRGRKKELVSTMESAYDKPKRERVPAASASKRLVINYAREEGMFMVSVEESPDWDLVGRPKKVSYGSLLDMLPLVASLGVKVKNMTEETELGT